MFGFGKDEPAPVPCPTNPGIGHEAKVGFANDRRSWTECVSIVELARSALGELGYKVSDKKTWLLHKESGFCISPQLVELQPLEGGGVRTVTTVQTNHAKLIPDGLFEYQHSNGSTVADSITKGFENWARMDFVTLLESLSTEPTNCTSWMMELPATDGKPARIRRAVLGPVAHYSERPQPAPAGGDDHAFCPCCLLTRSFLAFKDLMAGDRTFGVRMFAARNQDGEAQADCRVNGDDWEAGAEALREYVRTWPDAGFEFRKQYIVMHDIA